MNTSLRPAAVCRTQISHTRAKKGLAMTLLLLVAAVPVALWAVVDLLRVWHAVPRRNADMVLF